MNKQIFPDKILARGKANSKQYRLEMTATSYYCEVKIGGRWIAESCIGNAPHPRNPTFIHTEDAVIMFNNHLDTLRA